MYSVSKDFISAIKNNARYIKAYFAFDGNTYDLVTVNIDAAIYKKTNDYEGFIGTFIGKSGTIKIPVSISTLVLEDKSIDLFFGVQLADGTIEYVPQGRYQVYEKTSNVEYKICDKKALFNEKIDKDEIVYPTTPSILVEWICSKVGIEIILPDDLPNKNISIPSEIFFGYDATYANVVEAVAQATCSFAQISKDNALEFKWFKAVDFSIEINNMTKGYPVYQEMTNAINSVVLAREPQNDNVFIPEIIEGERVEFKISNNPILDLDRYSSREDIYQRMKGFCYQPVSLVTQGFFHLDVGDVVKLQQKDGSYEDMFIMNYSLKYSGGISSNFETPSLSKTMINYAAASSWKSQIYNTQLQVDKVNNRITAEISEIDKEIQKIDVNTIQLNNIKDGTVLNEEVASIELSAQIMQAGKDVTADIPEISFTWQRKSKDTVADTEWNEAHKYMKNIIVTHDDVDQSASFQVTVKTESYTKVSGYETITDESDIPKLSVFIDSNLPEYQRCDELEMDPSWNPLILTPEVKDGLLQIPLSSCEIAWRRSDGAIGEGETIADGTLKVVNNKLSEVSSGTITYICEVKFKNYMSLASKSFVLIADGSTGTGVKSVSAEYYLSTSKEEQEGGEWLEKPPTWSTGKYLWTRTKTIYTDDTETYTEPLCDSTWDAVNELEETVNKKIDADLSTVEERITETYNSALELTKSEINMSVEKVSESTSNLSRELESISSNQLKLTSEYTEFVKETVDTLEDIKDGKMGTAKILEWARFDGSSLELGASNSPFKAILSNTELAFWQGNTKVTWISNNELHVAYAVVMESLKIGPFIWTYIKSVGLVLKRWKE